MSAFQVQPNYTYGNSGRNILSGPGYEDVSVSLLKDSRIREGLDLQFRAEFFNVINHTNFDLPDQYNLSGLVLVEEEGKIKVYEVIKNSPAEKVKIKSGDGILSINNVSVSDYSLQQIRDILNQKEGNKITLKIKNQEKTKTVKLVLIELI